MRVLLLPLLAACVCVVAALPGDVSQRIVGGTVTNIRYWPMSASLLYSWNLNSFTQACGGTILTSTAILSAAHCFHGDGINRWRVRVGSTYANSGGIIHMVRLINSHPQFNAYTYDSDVAVLRTSTNIVFNVNAQAGSIAGANYNVADNQILWAIGWGAIAYQGQWSEPLRQVQIWSVNQALCRTRFNELRLVVTDNMLCAGWLDVGGRDQCQGDDGSPLFHNNVIVGIRSWGAQCGLPRFPGVNTRVSRFTAWIQTAAA